MKVMGKDVPQTFEASLLFASETFEKSKVSNVSEHYETCFRSFLNVSPDDSGIVYIFRTHKKINRLKGKSDIAYIGKTDLSFKDRYKPIVKAEVRDFGDRYQELIDSYDGFYIEIYKTVKPRVFEDYLLHLYRSTFLELPPLNLKSYSSSYDPSLYQST